MTALAYDLAPHLGKFRTDSTADEKNDGKEARYTVLSYLVLRSNVRRRAYPAIETIAKETGYGKQRVIDALEWLKRRGAIVDVPRNKRVADEQKIHFNRAVYQLTGFIKLCGETIRYLHLGQDQKPETPEDYHDNDNLTVSSETEPTKKSSVRKTNDSQFGKRELIGSGNVNPSLYERNHLNDSKERKESPLTPDEPAEDKSTREGVPGEAGAAVIPPKRKPLKTDMRQKLFEVVCIGSFGKRYQDINGSRPKANEITQKIHLTQRDITPEQLEAGYRHFAQKFPDLIKDNDRRLRNYKTILHYVGLAAEQQAGMPIKPHRIYGDDCPACKGGLGHDGMIFVEGVGAHHCETCWILIPEGKGNG